MKFALLAIAALLLLTPAAEAVPPGKYTCAEQGIVFGSVTFKANRYKMGNGARGHYRQKARRLTFTRYLRKWKGRVYWTRTPWNDRLSEVVLRRGNRAVFCTRLTRGEA